jgi:hypothetical protein
MSRCDKVSYWRMLCVCIIFIPSQSNAIPFDFVPYQGAFDGSDLVVIARPIATNSTEESTTLSSFALTGYSGQETRVPVVGIETKFVVDAILKGDKTIATVTLHHYLIIDMKSTTIPHFDSSADYILFLTRESDGRYAPTGGEAGKAHPELTSIKRLD